jgi:hypothetical protein
LTLKTARKKGKIKREKRRKGRIQMTKKEK